jgi:hypothetical protein
VQDAEIRRFEVKDSQTLSLDFITVCKAVPVFVDAPFLGKVRIFGAIETQTVVVVRLAETEYGLLDYPLGTMKDSFPHSADIILLQEYGCQ